MPKVIKRPVPGPGGPPASTTPGLLRPQAPSVIGPSKLAPHKKVIPQELVGANAEARRIVGDAEEEAQRIRDEAEAQAAERREQGYQDGLEEGKAVYTQQVTEAIMQLRDKEAGLEAEFIKLVRACVEKILGQELKLHPDAVTGIVRNALQDARQQRDIVVRVNPEDSAQLKKHQGRLMEVLVRANGVEIRDDATVTRGGCIVMTELGTIDASLSRQLDAIASAIDEELRSGSPDDLGEDPPPEQDEDESY